jgi:hypothetical protein
MVAIIMGVGHAEALLSVESRFFKGEDNIASDNDASYLINVVGAPTILDVGDRVQGILSINTIEGQSSGNVNAVGVAGFVNEFTAVFDFTAAAAFVPGTLLAGAPVACAPAKGVSCDYLFGPTKGFDVLIGLKAGDFKAGTTIALFEDSAVNFTRILKKGVFDDGAAPFPPGTADIGVGPFASEVSLRGTAMDGGIANLRVLLGFGGDPDELILATSLGSDITAIKTTAAGSIVGGFNVQQSILQNNFLGLAFQQVNAGVTIPGSGGNGKIDVNGSGSLLGGGCPSPPASAGVCDTNTPFDSFSNVDFTVHPVFEPGSLLLFGSTLVAAGFGAGVVRYRKGTKK